MTPEITSLPQLHRTGTILGVLWFGLLLTVILPAERGVDPTGVGGWLGLTAMGEAKTATAVVPGGVAPRKDSITVTLLPGRGTEVKARLREGDRMDWRWSTEGEAFYDFHGEPEGAAKDVFTSFDKGTATHAEGSFVAPFTGVHGWYWKNRSPGPITITLDTEGNYVDLRRL